MKIRNETSFIPFVITVFFWYPYFVDFYYIKAFTFIPLMLWGNVNHCWNILNVHLGELDMEARKLLEALSVAERYYSALLH